MAESKSVQAIFDELINATDQLFRQRHTKKDIEWEKNKAKRDLYKAIVNNERWPKKIGDNNLCTIDYVNAALKLILGVE